MPRQKINLPFWAKGGHFTSKQIQQINNSPCSVAILNEAKRLQLEQQEKNKILIQAAIARGDLRR